jgi:hypothetical protein
LAAKKLLLNELVLAEDPMKRLTRLIVVVGRARQKLKLVRVSVYSE